MYVMPRAAHTTNIALNRQQRNGDCEFFLCASSSLCCIQRECSEERLTGVQNRRKMKIMEEDIQL